MGINDGTVRHDFMEHCVHRFFLQIAFGAVRDASFRIKFRYFAGRDM